ncbi:hypothetical protein [Arthrobacter sp. H14-L1]|uniref:hypothetical protein n=1 Tax=Arthrobacter sp. H14-L1 TaxID=2996697 RepID=UPI00226D719B|nr:hypothetical protein [Arthrobacter sp. H14-L1]MCY0904414.1 hypothetical protein [Arthrobacter sp. H14-L1]
MHISPNHTGGLCGEPARQSISGVRWVHDHGAVGTQTRVNEAATLGLVPQLGAPRGNFRAGPEFSRADRWLVSTRSKGLRGRPPSAVIDQGRLRRMEIRSF